MHLNYSLDNRDRPESHLGGRIYFPTLLFWIVPVTTNIPNCSMFVQKSMFERITIVELYIYSPHAGGGCVVGYSFLKRNLSFGESRIILLLESLTIWNLSSRDWMPRGSSS